MAMLAYSLEAKKHPNAYSSFVKNQFWSLGTVLVRLFNNGMVATNPPQFLASSKSKQVLLSHKATGTQICCYWHII